jgi:hypothetical protein
VKSSQTRCRLTEPKIRVRLNHLTAQSVKKTSEYDTILALRAMTILIPQNIGDQHIDENPDFEQI